MKLLLWSAMVGAGLSLAGCGGGGGDASATAGLSSVPLTLANYAPTGRSAASTLVDVQASSAVDGLAGVGSAGAGSAGVASGSSVAGLARSLYDGARQGFGRDRPAASETATRACAGGGSVTVTANDNNNNGDLDAGDSLSAQFSACAVEVGETPIDGGMDITVTSVSQTAASLALNLRALRSGGNTLNGQADLSVNGSRVTLSYRAATASRGNATTVYNFTAVVDGSGVRPTATVSGQIGIAGAAYTLSTPTTIVMGVSWPSSGVLRVADAAGGRVDVVMRASDFDLDLYLPGDETRDARTTHTWAQLAAGTF